MIRLQYGNLRIYPLFFSLNFGFCMVKALELLWSRLGFVFSNGKAWKGKGTWTPLHIYIEAAKIGTVFGTKRKREKEISLMEFRETSLESLDCDNPNFRNWYFMRTIALILIILLLLFFLQFISF